MVCRAKSMAKLQRTPQKSPLLEQAVNGHLEKEALYVTSLTMNTTART